MPDILTGLQQLGLNIPAGLGPDIQGSQDSLYQPTDQMLNLGAPLQNAPPKPTSSGFRDVLRASAAAFLSGMGDAMQVHYGLVPMRIQKELKDRQDKLDAQQAENDAYRNANYASETMARLHPKPLGNTVKIERDDNGVLHYFTISPDGSILNHQTFGDAKEAKRNLQFKEGTVNWAGGPSSSGADYDPQTGELSLPGPTPETRRIIPRAMFTPGSSGRNVPLDQQEAAIRAKLRDASLTSTERKALQSQLEDIKTVRSEVPFGAADIRATSFGNIRGIAMIDTQNGNSPIEMNINDVNDANKKQPGRFIPLQGSERALKQRALIEDINGAIGQVRESLDNPKMPEFDTRTRAQIYAALNSLSPQSAISGLLQSKIGETLTPEQQDYLANMSGLIEQAMAMRQVLGAGQGSEDLRKAIKATIPGATVISKQYAKKQLDVFQNTLNRLSRGIINVPLGGNSQEVQNVPHGTPGEGTVAVGPNGHKIIVKNGQWVDFVTGTPVK